jgi:branched-chain amino acid transport system substrate-binding protein
MSMFKTRRTGALLLVSTLMFAAACDNDPVEPDGAGEVLIGGLFSLTGNWSTLGVTAKAALELAVEDVNAQLAAGESGLSFVAAVEDTKLDPDLALAAAQRLKTRGAEILVGPQSSAEVVKLREWANTNGVLIVSPSSTAGTLAIANDNVLRLTPADSLEASALVALIQADAKTSIVPMWRDDSGNDGLAIATRAQFTRLNGTVSVGAEYSATETNFATALAAVKTQVQAAIAAVGASKVAVAHAGFDEAVDIFKLAAADPVLSSVRWYGTDGTALSEPLRANAQATAFAQTVGFMAPIFGVDPSASARWQPIAARITTRAGRAPDAFALAVYDAVLIAAQAYLAMGARSDIATLRGRYVESAGSFYGTTGWTKLNAAGDRQFGNFDFFSLKTTAGSTSWLLSGTYDTQTHTLTRN